MIEIDQIILAQNTKDESILALLARSVYVSVRRSVAKNIASTKQILEQLCQDPSMNVTYIANKFCQNNKIKRDIISNNPCVICLVDEKDYINVCGSCEKIDNHKKYLF